MTIATPPAPLRSFDNVQHWVFDLDNTLYPREAQLFALIEARMTDWVMRALRLERAAANALRADYFRRYGTTLAGLMQEHGVDPLPYLGEVHEIPLDALAPDVALAASIRRLPGRRIVFTNGSRRHAERVCAARGLSDCFDALYGVEDADFRPKPLPEAFDRVFALARVDPARGAMFEDEPANLTVPEALGMVTVHVAAQRHPGGHVHHHAPDLGRFLAALAPDGRGPQAG